MHRDASLVPPRSLGVDGVRSAPEAPACASAQSASDSLYNWASLACRIRPRIGTIASLSCPQDWPGLSVVHRAGLSEAAGSAPAWVQGYSRFRFRILIFIGPGMSIGQPSAQHRFTN